MALASSVADGQPAITAIIYVDGRPHGYTGSIAGLRHYLAVLEANHKGPLQ